MSFSQLPAAKNTENKTALTSLKSFLFLDDFNILGASHCVDMYENQPGDPDELQVTRAMIGELVSKWIMEANA